jgi:hypothetical protein
MGREMGKRLTADMRRTGRFVVTELSGYRDCSGNWLLGGDDAKGFLAGSVYSGAKPNDLDIIVSGRLYDLDLDVTRTRTKNKKEKGKKRSEYTYSWEVEARVKIQHIAKLADSGEVWREVGMTKTKTETFSSEPLDSQLEDIVFDLAKGTMRGWVRQMVPEATGEVTRIEGKRIVVNLGRRDGIGNDVDFMFYRMLDVMGDDGQPIREISTGSAEKKDVTEGEPLADDTLRVPGTEQSENATEKQKILVMARPDKDHESPFPCVGRPVQIEEDYCLVEIGYNGSGGFFGPDVKWKARETMLSFIQPGDIVVLTPRDANAK